MQKHWQSKEAGLSMLDVTAKQLVDSVIKIAEEQPNYVYEPPESDEGDCMYFHPETKQPSCLIGYALADNGITFDDLDELGIDNAGDDAASVCWKVDASSDTDLVDFLQMVQGDQDYEVPWGEAVRTHRWKFNV